jgi:hypothetical protein
MVLGGSRRAAPASAPVRHSRAQFHEQQQPAHERVRLPWQAEQTPPWLLPDPDPVS